MPGSGRSAGGGIGYPLQCSWASLVAQLVKILPDMQDLGSIPGLGRPPGEGKGCPLQYSGLENSMDCIVHGVAKSQTWLSYFHSLWLGCLQSSTTFTFFHELFQSSLVMHKGPIPKSSGNLRRPWDLRWWRTWDFSPSSFSYFEVCASSPHQDVFYIVQA